MEFQILSIDDCRNKIEKNNKDKIDLIENGLNKMFNKDDILQQCINTKSKFIYG